MKQVSSPFNPSFTAPHSPALEYILDTHKLPLQGTIKQVREVDFTGPYSLAGTPRLRHHSRHSEAAQASQAHHQTSQSSTEDDASQDSSARPHRCLLDVMFVNLVNMDIFTGLRSPMKRSKRRHKHVGRESSGVPAGEHGRKISDGGRKSSNGGRKDSGRPRKGSSVEEDVAWVFGSYVVKRVGSSLLHDKCALTLQVERNLDTAVSHAG